MNRSIFRIYIKPFLDSGVYGDWINVSKDVVFSSIKSIKQDLDNTEYDIGIFRTSSVSFTLRNNHGNYSDTNILQSIFRYKRAESLVKITWTIDDEQPICGSAYVGDCYLFDDEEIEVFKGLLSDESSNTNIDTLLISFNVIGLDSLLARESVPFSSISAGNTVEAILFACLNQAKITSLLTVSAANISTSVNSITDVITTLQGKTVLEAVKELLKISNSVLYILNDTIFIKPRTPTASVIYNFFGQASIAGIENVENITGVKTGSQRIFNYVNWKDTSTIRTDSASIALWGVKKKEFDSGIITNTTRRQTILDAVLEEFKSPQQEFTIQTPLTIETIQLTLLDRVVIDYPIQFVETENPLPICGAAICGEAVLPAGIWAFLIPDTDNYKIMNKQIDIAGGKVILGLRKV